MEENTADPDDWRAIAFSHQQIKDFLEIAALPEATAREIFGGRSAQLRCFGTGFYFFSRAIESELNPQLANDLSSLAVRVEQFCLNDTLGSWTQNAAEASRLLDLFFRP